MFNLLMGFWFSGHAAMQNVHARFEDHRPVIEHRVKPTPTPTVKPVPVVRISDVKVHNCSKHSSCYGWMTGVEVMGKNFADDSRVKLLSGGTEYTGNYQGGNDKTRILTDFTNLPHCKTFDAVVFGSTGVATASASVRTVCP
jgi:hypothetical protein